MLFHVYTTPDGTTSEVVAATGKFEGIQLKGSVIPVGPFPAVKPGTFEACNHQTGTYKLR